MKKVFETDRLIFRGTNLLALLLAVVLRAHIASAEPVPVRHTEGVVHGFLVLRTLEGKTLATGEVTQSPHGGQMTSRLVFRFQDGSHHEETSVYSQRVNFRLLKYHLVQKGPSFPQKLDLSIDRSGSRVTVRYSDKDGTEKVITEQMELPLDLANGLVLTLLKNIGPALASARVSMLATTPKPRLVKVAMTSASKDSFSVGGLTREATHYVLKVEIGGVTGLIAPIVGKQPPDHHVWMIGGDAPGFVKSEGTLYLGGPSWRIELASPVWPKRP